MPEASTEIHNAYLAGDAAALRRLVGDDFWRVASGVAPIPLEYAIYHSPLELVTEMIELGADVNYEDPAGFPSLIAALSTDRRDLVDLIELLLEAGADLAQRGVNDFTPLHYAAAHQSRDVVQLLVDRGADVDARTRIDDLTTPLDEARNAGRDDVVELLETLS